VMGWEFQDWGPGYAAFDRAGVPGGFNGNDGVYRPKAPLVIVETEDLEAMEAEVTAAGGTITVPIFSYPGGRRFHFADPAGNELAVMQPE
jgi:predicted enzyme related to lactoylglutathione lyase